ncbi:MAG: SPFH domain-containing protein [Anaerovibrio sp.]|uniref:SPFH domain-containing protein n=1 Tax=Anaerovibrio sp. TaxID=1872532 RepID=UPI0025C141F6|nr:SPFH domain-containing protein [Anaerovibrio sp.]MBE6099949.1 SPFH domain-containing protein [Anaerovibrio sp.]
MGLIKAAMGAAGGTLADQWKEFIYCESIPADLLVVKGQKRTSSQGRSSNTSAEDNVISNGSVIAVNTGQCMIIVEQGKVVDICAEPGEYKYDTSLQPSIFTGDLGSNVKAIFGEIGKRFTFGGDPGKDQRVYFVNTKEIIGNKYGTPSPIPFDTYDKRSGLSMTVSLRCFGEYSYRITNPILFYTNVCANITDSYPREQIDSQMKSELMTKLQPALARLSEQEIKYSSIPAHVDELADILNDLLSKKWGELRGIEIVSFGVSSVKASDEDEEKIKDYQRYASMGNAQMAGLQMAGATADSMKMAASNEGGAGAMGAFMGMGMAGGIGGGQAAQMMQVGAMQQAQQPQQPPQAPPQQVAPAAAASGNSWKCSCGADNTGKFCVNCGSKKPEAQGWTCSCGAVNQGKFCPQCGAKKPADAPLYKCDKCGWVPEDPHNPPKFCPECGDAFDDNDIQ